MRSHICIQVEAESTRLNSISVAIRRSTSFTIAPYIRYLRALIFLGPSALRGDADPL